MLSTNIGAIQTFELSSDDCGQEAKRVLEELEILTYAMDLEMKEEELWKKEIFERSNRALKILMVRNLSKEEKLEDLRKKLIMKVREKEEKNKKAKELQELTEKLITTVKEAMRNNKRKERASIMKCFYCDRPGHGSRTCFREKLRKDIIFIKAILSILFMTAKPKVILKLSMKEGIERLKRVESK